MDTVLSPHLIFVKNPIARAFLGCIVPLRRLARFKRTWHRVCYDIGMDNSMNKASVSLLAMATLVIAAIAAKIRASAEAQAPEGYEDATGFHFGHPNFEE
jgi:hypothetical protein